MTLPAALESTVSTIGYILAAMGALALVETLVPPLPAALIAVAALDFSFYAAHVS